jgi:hypothetical protein
MADNLRWFRYSSLWGNNWRAHTWICNCRNIVGRSLSCASWETELLLKMINVAPARFVDEIVEIEGNSVQGRKIMQESLSWVGKTFDTRIGHFYHQMVGVDVPKRSSVDLTQVVEMSVNRCGMSCGRMSLTRWWEWRRSTCFSGVESFVVQR